MLRFIYCYAECRYADCYYASCRYAQCRGASGLRLWQNKLHQLHVCCTQAYFATAVSYGRKMFIKSAPGQTLRSAVGVTKTFFLRRSGWRGEIS